ncbi:MAG: ABC transporter permease [Maribacter sp.]
MFKNCLKVACRNLWRHSGFSFLNIVGLSIGLTASFLILLYIGFELSYDRFHCKADNIYRVVVDLETPTGLLKESKPAWAAPYHMQKEFSEVESAVRIWEISLQVHKNGERYNERGLAVDPDFFNVFDFKLLTGNREKVLVDPFSIVLSKSMARKYFGNQNPIGKPLDIEDFGFVGNITGVMDDMPGNSHIAADILVSITTFFTKNYSPGMNDNWEGYSPDAYVLLQPNVSSKVLESKFPDFLERNDGDNMRKREVYVTLYLEPFKDVYLRSDRYSTISGDSNTIYVLAIVALFILLIAGINFINLTTARAIERAKEVGMRKVIGAKRRQLAFQFVRESTMVCVIAFFLTIMLSALLLPFFNDMAGKTVSQSVFVNPDYLVFLFGVAILIGILSGVYPAFVLSSFKPIDVLKGSFSGGLKGVRLRKGLVVVQFAISITLIIGTIIIYNQMDFMRNQDLGFNKEQTLLLNSANNELKDAIENLPGVTSTSRVSSIPGGDNDITYSKIVNVDGNQQIVAIDAYYIDFEAMTQFELKLVAGRGFSRDFSTDSTEAMVINEKAVKLLGYPSPKDVLGAKFEQGERSGKVVGVVQDFHFKSLKEDIKPLTIRIDLGRLGNLAVKLKPQDVLSTVASIEEKWKALEPKKPFEYYFLDEYFDRQYRSEVRFGNLIFNFSLLAIIISCFGLFGLTAYSAVQRRKEIGIRKVIGASVIDIVRLLSKDFLRLIGIAFLIASPLAWLAMDSWLTSFAYRIEIKWWVFGFAGVSAFSITLLTVGFHALKAAFVEPVESLRTE